MTQKLTIQCHEPTQAHKALVGLIWPLLKASLIAGKKMVVRVEPETRSLAENAMLHAMLTKISKQKEWAGAKRDAEVWKRLLTAAWLRANGHQLEILPALDGHGVDVVMQRTSTLTKAECADLIEFILAWAAENEIYL